MVLSVIESWLLLLYFDGLMKFRGFKHVHAAVRRQPAARTGSSSATALCRAMDIACVLYFKRVLCLQRSSATAVLLRRHGLKAEMVIGVRLFPFYSHAWVEIEERVVNDKTDFTRMFQVMERC